jgi:hypothetical protein
MIHAGWNLKYSAVCGTAARRIMKELDLNGVMMTILTITAAALLGGRNAAGVATVIIILINVALNCRK